MSDIPSQAERQKTDADQFLRLPISQLKGVNPSLFAPLARLGIYRVFDLLFYFPRDYQDCRPRRFAEIEENVMQSICGTIEHFSTRRTRRGTILTLDVNVEGETIQAIWFNQIYYYSQFRFGRRLMVTGKPQWKSPGFWQTTHPKLTFFPDDEFVPDVETEPNADETPSRKMLNEILADETTESETPTKKSNLETPPQILPIYPLTEGISQFQLQRLVKKTLKNAADLLSEVFPDDFRQERRLPSIADAIRKIHFPRTESERDEARRRFVYQELLVLQLALAIRRQQRRVGLRAPVLERTAKIDARIRSLIPFDLTDVQNQVVEEISNDLAKPVPMNRLLQGDVGSGKTIVAVYAALQAVANGYQTVLMAPTEVLARQHLRTFQNLLGGKKVRIAPIFGGQKPKERAAILQDVLTGTAQIVVGTQAIICNEIEFHRLGLVVVDEQHKFGVRQRAALKTGTKSDPHYLVMTATPIPRSVTMTLFGDLDVSILGGYPPGRQKISTSLANLSQKPIWWDFFRKKLLQGRQGYVVVPRVDEGDQEELRSVQAVFDELSAGELNGFRLGMIHGRMTTEEKEAVMLDFRSGEIQVLISTSVIEVGVDIPNATLMTIENAEIFGLAQLHQLRGRIGRGKYPGFCCVFATEKSEIRSETENDSANAASSPAVSSPDVSANVASPNSDFRDVSTENAPDRTDESKKIGSVSSTTKPSRTKSSRTKTESTVAAKSNVKKTKSSRSKSQKSESPDSEPDQAAARRRDEALERLKFFVETTDGFKLAEKDLELRGPGDLFGTRQHGFPPFRIADVVRDYNILVEAKNDATRLVQDDPGLASPEHQKLRRQVLARYGKVLELGDVG